MVLHPPPSSRALPGARASRAVDCDFASVFAVTTVASAECVEDPAATTSAAQPTPSRSSVQRTDWIEHTGQTASFYTSPGSPAPRTMTHFSDRISPRTRRRSVTAAGKAPLLSTNLRARRGPSAILRTSYNPAAYPTPLAGSARRRDSYSCRPAGPNGPLPSDHDHAEPMGIPLLRLTPFPW